MCKDSRCFKKSSQTPNGMQIKYHSPSLSLSCPVSTRLRLYWIWIGYNFLFQSTWCNPPSRPSAMPWELFELLLLIHIVCMSRQMNHLLIYVYSNIVILKANIDKPAFDCVLYDKINKRPKDLNGHLSIRGFIFGYQLLHHRISENQQRHRVDDYA